MPISAATARRHVRRSLVQLAELRVASRKNPFFCIIRDLSDGGAQLRIPVEVPTEGICTLSAPAIGVERPVRIVWRAVHSMGVAFEKSAA